MDLRSELKAIEPELIELRRDIHMHPELGFEEFRTAELIENYFAKLGIETKRVAKTGVIALLKGGKPGKTLLLRADMDALPVLEDNDLPFKSQVPGKMHACGHDTHVSMLLAAAKILSAHKDELVGNVKFVFEPAEEIDDDTGAFHMVRAGALENPKVDASMGIHIWATLDKGLIGIPTGAAMAEMYSFKLTLIGKGGHTSAPQEAVDPIICAANIITAVQAIQTRQIDPRDATVIMFGSVQGGDASNVIPESVVLKGSLRYMYDGSEDGPQHPCKRFKEMVEGLAKVYGCKCELEFGLGNHTAINDANFVSFMKANVINKMEDAEPVEYSNMGGEDFGEFANGNGIPGALIFLGTKNPEIGADAPHHNSKFMIDESVLVKGVELHVRTALEYLK